MGGNDLRVKTNYMNEGERYQSQLPATPLLVCNLLLVFILVLVPVKASSGSRPRSSFHPCSRHHVPSFLPYRRPLLDISPSSSLSPAFMVLVCASCSPHTPLFTSMAHIFAPAYMLLPQQHRLQKQPRQHQ